QLKLYAEDDEESFRVAEDEAVYGLEERVARLEAEMKEAASHLEFERAALIRDEIRQMRGEYGKGRG
ncbi:UvrB/UvrC motif-containing protein, partial [Akkermansia muciniphila]